MTEPEYRVTKCGRCQAEQEANWLVWAMKECDDAPLWKRVTYRKQIKANREVFEASWEKLIARLCVTPHAADCEYAATTTKEECKACQFDRRQQQKYKFPPATPNELKLRYAGNPEKHTCGF